MAAGQTPRRPFDRAFRWLLLITVFWSFNALAATGELPVLVALGGYPLLVIAWMGERHYPLGKWTWRLLTLGALVYLGWYFEARARTDAIVYLLLFLLVNKLWTPKKPRDILQIYVICFFFMLSASILTMSMLFMFFFIGYVFLLVVGMGFLTVRREHETLAALGADRRAGINPEVDVPTGYYWRAWGVVALIFFFTFWIFTLFPRFTEQRLLPTMRGFSDSARTGFSNDIRLGSADRIDMDPTVVMRVMLQTRDSSLPLEHLYLRGAVLEHYDQGHWKENPSVHRIEREGRYMGGNYHTLQQMIPPGDYVQVRQLIYLNPSGTGNIFMLENAAQVRVMLSRYLVEHDIPANTVRVLTMQNRVFQYGVVSYVRKSHVTSAASQPARSSRGTPVTYSSPTREMDLSKSAQSIAKAFQTSIRDGMRESASAAKRLGFAATFREAYLQTPDSPRQKQVEQLAGKVISAADATTAEEKARAIERYLQRTCSYSLENLSFGRREPTEAFLLDEKKGHCEYFASAMALMLRHVGVPSRVVNGYFTDRWNDLGDYFQVEKADAHSWVEAFLDEAGWVAFDPSPPGDIARGSMTEGWMYRLRFWSDAIKMKWRMYVIDYDLTDQGQFLRSLGDTATPERVGPMARWLGRSRSLLIGDTSPRELVGKTIVAAAVAIVVIAFGMATFFAARLVGRRRGKSKRLQAILQQRRVALYEKILRELGRRGLQRKQALTPLEFARQVEDVRPDLAGFVALTRQYYEVRYAEREIGPADVAAFNNFLKRAKAHLPRQRLKQA